jgi:threonine/homoserine/homoserine lactone efflux protein
VLAAVLAFAGVAAVINVTPGLDTMLVLRTSVAGGRAIGLVSGLGINVGCLAWGLAAAAGITELLAASHVAYDAVRIAGAAYLTWLGCCALWRSTGGGRGGRQKGGRGGRQRGVGQRAEADEPGVAGTDAPPAEAIAAGPGPGRLAAFRSGLTTNLLNPKAGVFYMSLLPQFIRAASPFSVLRCC